jgi:hypothetical protein
MVKREVAQFNDSAFIGFEEIFRDYILSYKDQSKTEVKKVSSQGTP